MKLMRQKSQDDRAGRVGGASLEAPTALTTRQDLEAATAENARLEERREQLLREIADSKALFAELAEKAAAGDEEARQQSRHVRAKQLDAEVDVECVVLALQKLASRIERIHARLAAEHEAETYAAALKRVAGIEDDVVAAIGEAFDAAEKMIAAAKRIHAGREQLLEEPVKAALSERGSMARISRELDDRLTQSLERAGRPANDGVIDLPAALFRRNAL